MSFYPTKPSTFLSLIGQSFKYYGKIFKIIVPLSVLAAFIKDFYVYVGGLPSNRWHPVFVFIMVVLEVYVWAVALYNADSILKRESLGLSDAFRHVYRKISSIYAGFFAIVIGFCLVLFVGYLLSNLVMMFFGNQTIARGIVLLFLVGFPLTVGLVLCVLVLPLLILERLTLRQALRQSITLVGSTNFLRAFSLYAIYIAIFLITFPNTLHGKWFVRHYLIFVFDVVVFVITAPLTINFLLLLLNDLRLRNLPYSQ